MRPYYQDHCVTIFHGDCREVPEWLHADTLVTDPPYGIGYASGWPGKFSGVLIEGDIHFDAEDPLLFLLSNWGSRPALIFGSPRTDRPKGSRQVLIWEKGEHVGMGDLALPWRPNYEEIYVFGSGFQGHRSSAVLRHNAISPNFTPPERRYHPAEKPLSLMHDLVDKCPPGMIADPFMGSGTTLLAAKNLWRPAIGVEREERYCEIAATRLAQEVLPLRLTENATVHKGKST